MLDRRKFLGLMFGAACVPKDVLAGLVTPAPARAAIPWCTFAASTFIMFECEYTLATGKPLVRSHVYNRWLKEPSRG